MAWRSGLMLTDDMETSEGLAIEREGKGRKTRLPSLGRRECLAKVGWTRVWWEWQRLERGNSQVKKGVQGPFSQGFEWEVAHKCSC
ncbi:hypothetical protein SUGI_0752870 [Cryptomeria japonica]|nr:hypothetical protein SUGI_0752870 [Cryptomeria japonica]